MNEEKVIEGDFTPVEKPLIVRLDETKQKIVDALNESQLEINVEYYLVEEILRSLTQFRDQNNERMRQEYATRRKEK